MQAVFYDREFNAAGYLGGLFEVKSMGWGLPGGSKEAVLRMAVQDLESELARAVESLRFGVDIHDDAGVVVWNGYVHAVEIRWGRLRLEVSLDEYGKPGGGALCGFETEGSLDAGRFPDRFCGRWGIGGKVRGEGMDRVPAERDAGNGGSGGVELAEGKSGSGEKSAIRSQKRKRGLFTLPGLVGNFRLAVLRANGRILRSSGRGQQGTNPGEYIDLYQGCPEVPGAGRGAADS